MTMMTRVVMETAVMMAVRRLSSKKEVFNELGAAEGREAVSDSGKSVVVILTSSLVVWITGLVVLSTRMSRIVDPSEEEIIVDIDSELRVSTIVLVSLSVSLSVSVGVDIVTVRSEGENVVTSEEFGSTRAAK